MDRCTPVVTRKLTCRCSPYTPLQANYGGGFSDDFLLVLSPAANGLTGEQSSGTETRNLRRPLPAGGGMFIRR